MSQLLQRLLPIFKEWISDIINLNEPEITSPNFAACYLIPYIIQAYGELSQYLSNENFFSVIKQFLCSIKSITNINDIVYFSTSK